MTTCAEITEILKKPDKETVQVELKESALLRNGDGQKKLGYEVVALANRYGGKLILGIKDDGTFEGRNIFVIDKDKSVIDNICRTNISPVIDYDVDFLQCDKGDLLVINVPKRKDIPHAYIDRRNGSEIKNRIYYIRTSHGKRLVSDKELSWLFTHIEDPDFVLRFRLVINFIKDSLKIPGNISQPSCISNYVWFVNSIPEEDISKVTKDWDIIQSFFLDITPYSILHSLSWLFTHSWLINIQRNTGRVRISSSLSKNVQSRKCTVDDLPMPYEESIINSLSWNFKDVLMKSGFQDFCLPANANIFIERSGINSVILDIRHPEHFNINITISKSHMARGLHFTHPLRAVFFGREMDNAFQNVEFDCTLSASFKFPEREIELFNEYENYANTIREHLSNDWDWDNFLGNLPDSILYKIENKLDVTLKRLESK